MDEHGEHSEEKFDDILDYIKIGLFFSVERDGYIYASRAISTILLAFDRNEGLNSICLSMAGGYESLDGVHMYGVMVGLQNSDDVGPSCIIFSDRMLSDQYDGVVLKLTPKRVLKIKRELRLVRDIINL